MTRLELGWPNKDRFLLVPKDDAGKPVWVDRNHPAASEVRVSDFTSSVGEVNDEAPFADNLLFTGDSLDVLRILAEVPEYRRVYRGKVKQVYIDPPFNTGQAFAHYDDWLEHATWLSFMRERLLLIRDLLSPTGTLWLHLDNFEVHRMRVLLDEVFGADNYLNTVVWKRTGAKSAARRGLGTMYDNLLVYGATEAASLNSLVLPYSAAYLQSKYSNEVERGRYQLTSLLASGVRTGDSGQPWQGVDPSAKKNHWRAPQAEAILGETAQKMTTREKLDALLQAGFIELSKKPGGTPRFKFYLQDEGGTLLGDFWSDINALNSQGKERVGYDTQKPEALLDRVLNLGSAPGDIVLDCFAGSGTTAAAAHRLGRRWVAAEVLRGTVNAFTKPRLEVACKEGGGFRCVEVGSSMYVDVPGIGVLLSDEATNGTFAKAVAGQLGYEFQPDATPLCGVRGRMRLAVLDGTVGEQEVRTIVAALNEGERVEIVGRAVIEGAEQVLASLAKGSKFTKAPRDLLTRSALRTRRRARREVEQ